MADDKFANFIEQVRSRSNIIDVCSRYVPLEKKGGRHWACCPIHHEKTPSFTVNEERGSYFCFGCHEHGDVFKLVMTLESCSFMDAVRRLAERAGMEVPDFRQSENNNEINAKKERLYAVVLEAARHYHANIYTPEGCEALEYAKKRGLNNETIKAFRLGYSLGYNEVVEHLKSKGFNNDEMLNAGVCAEKNGKIYDAFFKRLIIPIFNNANKVIAFGGRYLGDSDFAKYKNSKETLIFQKHNEIFGIHTLKQLKLSSGLSNVVVVEGYMDVISLYQSGIRNVCASMGTALTPNQCKSLKFLSNKILLCYDGDDAGQNATYKGIEVLREAGLNTKIVVLEDKLDPDEYIRKYGKDKFEQKLSGAIPPTQYQIQSLAKRYNLDEPDGRAAFAIEAVKIVAKLENSAEREVYLEQVASFSKIAMDALRSQLKEGAAINVKTARQTVTRQKLNKYIISGRALLYALYTESPFVNANDIDPEYFETEEHKKLFNNYIAARAFGESVDIATLASSNIAPAELQAISDMAKSIPIKMQKDYYASCLTELQKAYHSKQRVALSEKLTAASSDEERDGILREIEKLGK